MFSTISSLSKRPLRYGPKQQRGNALFIVLLGVVLFGALSFSLMRQESGSSSTARLDDDKAEIYATELINHANAVKQAISLMLETGSTVDDIDFVKPDEAGYDTSPYIHKVFHPGGGGITPFTNVAKFIIEAPGDPTLIGWQSRTITDTEWTPTTDTDLIYTFVYVTDQICAKINKQLNGSETVPVANQNIGTTFIDGTLGTPTSLTAATCSGCVGQYSLCISENGSTANAFYNFVAAR